MQTPDAETLKILRQPFLPQGASTRVRVSVSSCGSYVLKTPLSPKEIMLAFQRYGIDLGAVDWSPRPGDALAAAEELGKMSMESYRVAWERLREEAALRFVGPHPDRPDSFVILQDRAQLFVDFVRLAMRRREPQKAEQAIDSLLALTQSLWERHITENTFNFADNYGFIPSPAGPRIVLIDIGELETGADRVARQAQLSEMLKNQSFTRWLQPEFPALAERLAEGWQKLARSRLQSPDAVG